MNVKMIVTDLDGTLLRKNKTISDYTANVFSRCQKRGIKIMLATARPIRAVTDYLKIIPFDGAIYHNGAVIDTGEENIMRFGIPPQTTENIIFSALRADVSAKISVEIDDRLYSNFDTSLIWKNVESIQTDFTDLPSLSADKIIMPAASIHELKAVSDILPDNVYIEMSENTVGMIMNKNADKFLAVKRAAQFYSVALSEVAAFGDDYNDIKMLKGCGTGIAVANAIEEVKTSADFICGSNEDDGAAKWIEENIL